MEGFGTIKISDIAEINYEVLNAWSFELQYISPSVMTVYNNNKIEEVNCFDHIIKVGESITLSYGGGESVFNIREIEFIGSGKFRVYTTKPTKSRLFLLPIMGKNRKFWFYDSWLINCYISEDLQDLILEYRFAKNAKYLEFERTLRETTGFYKSEEVDHYSTLFFYKVPKQHLSDIIKFTEGKYSEFSSKLKDNILKFHNFSIGGKTWEILNKSPKLREQLEAEFDVPIHNNMELYDIPELKEEVYG